jgi:hypothetical protein
MKRASLQEGPLASITEEQWAEVWLKLRLHVWKRYYWLHKRLGENLDDIAHQSILDTMNGKRRWPPIDPGTTEVRRDIGLLSFLCEVARSKVSHIWAREKKRVSIDSYDSTDDSEEFNTNFIDHLLNESAKKFPHLLRPDDTEAVVIYNRVSAKMLDLVSSDPLVLRIVTLWREEPDLKPKDLATRLRLTMSEVRAAQKRLRRLVRVLKEDFSND